MVVEPCSGEHDITNVLRKHHGVEYVFTNDLDCKRDADLHLDAKDSAIYRGRNVSWVVTNPPFSEAFEILKTAYESCSDGCAFLVRLSFLEPTYDRGPWLAAHPPSHVLVLPRYSFTQNGKTDSVTCAWVVWQKGFSKQVLKVMPKQKRTPNATK